MSKQKTQDFMDVGGRALSLKEADVLIKKIRDAIDLADQSGYHSEDRIDVNLSFAKRGEWVPGPRPNWHYSVQAVQLRVFGSLSRRFIKRSVKVMNGKIDLQKLKRRRDELRALQSIENTQAALKKEQDEADRCKVNEKPWQTHRSEFTVSLSNALGPGASRT